MKRTSRDYVADILTCFLETQELTRDLDFETFAKDRKTVNAVVRSLEIMGEAAKRVPADLRDKFPEIPWKRMTGMRDKLIHEYSGVDLEIIWGVITEDLPPLKPLFDRLSQYLEKQE